MTALEHRLPRDVQALADWRGGEAGWRRADLPKLAAAARAQGLATLGGQVQVRLPDGTFELYWQDYDPGERRASEDWAAYRERTWREMLFLVDTLPSDIAILEGARRLSPELAGVSDAEAKAAMWFVVYLAAES